MKSALCLMMAVLGGFLSAADVRSSNTFVMADVSSTKTNTIVAVPWTGVDGDIRIDHLVWPNGLTKGDMLIAVTNGTGYAGWTLVGPEDGARSWEPMSTAQRPDATSRVVWTDHDGSGAVARGTGLWLIRQNTSSAFTLYGLATDSAATVTIRGGSSAQPTYTMVASPDVTQAVDVNALPWPKESVGKSDRIVVPTSTAASQNYLWDNAKQMWYYGRTSVKDGMIETTYVYDNLPIPAGTGFWYVRRTAGDFTLTFAAPSGGAQ